MVDTRLGEVGNSGLLHIGSKIADDSNSGLSPEKERSDSGIDKERSDSGIDIERSDSGIDIERSDSGIDKERSDSGIDKERSDSVIDKERERDGMAMKSYRITMRVSIAFTALTASERESSVHKNSTNLTVASVYWRKG